MTADNISPLNIPNIIPVILCGGAGTRLWPLSQGKTPKQLLPIVNKTILLHDTIQRISDCLDNVLPHVITVTTEELKEETLFQLNAFHLDCTQHVLYEPESKNTAAAIAYAALYAKENFGENSTLWIVPSDHYVDDHLALRRIFDQIEKEDIRKKIISFGAKPTSPETGYGYIQYDIENKSLLREVKSFKEKPDQKTAQEYLNNQNYLWNTGMVLASTETLLNNFIEYTPHTIAKIHSALSGKVNLKTAYKKIKNISFDHAIMEKTKDNFVVQIDIGWSDVGSWQSLWDIKDKDIDGNFFQGNISAQETQDCYIQSDSLTIATMGLKDVVIVEHEGQILVAHKEKVPHLKDLLQTLESQTPQGKTNTINEETLDQSDRYHIKNVHLKNTETTKYHAHQNRSEKIVILSGNAMITIDDNISSHAEGDIIHIPPTVFHKIENKSQDPLKFLEIHHAEDMIVDDMIREKKIVPNQDLDYA